MKFLTLALLSVLLLTPFNSAAAQRRELERVLVATWRANDRKEIEAAQQFGALRPTPSASRTSRGGVVSA